jgi:hypothetical protein
MRPSVLVFGIVEYDELIFSNTILLQCVILNFNQLWIINNGCNYLHVIIIYCYYMVLPKHGGKTLKYCGYSIEICMIIPYSFH